MLFLLKWVLVCYCDMSMVQSSDSTRTGIGTVPGRVTNCPGMPGTVPESRVCVPRPGQKQSGTIKCPGIGNTVMIMVKELHLARVAWRRHEVNA